MTGAAGDLPRGCDDGGHLPPPVELLLTSHVVARHAATMLAPTDLSLAQFAVLSALAGRRSLALTDVARVLAVRPQSAGELVDRLHRRGLVGRSHVGRRGSPVVVWATDAGRGLRRRAASLVGPLDDPSAWGLDRAGTAELVALLRTMRAAVAAPGDESSGPRESPLP